MPGVNIEAVQEQVVALVKRMEQEAEDLDYVINRIQTGVDFVPIEVQETIRQWKDGKAYKNDTFEDLKRKFRHKAYSIDDGWELYYMYSDWVVKQRQKLLVFVRLLVGVEPKPSEHFLATIKRAEQTEWDKESEMDMDVVFMLKDIRDIYLLSLQIEKRMKDLEVVCRQRSDMIISPTWEPKGSL